MGIRAEVFPFIGIAVGAGLVFAAVVHYAGASWVKAAWSGGALVLVASAYLLYFFRDPERVIPGNPVTIVAGADGKVAQITQVREDQFLKEETIRISIFLSLFNVHVNRAPIAGKSTFLGYYPGRRFFTFQEKSSWENQHNAILVDGERTRCLIRQIVGPVCRRVVYFLDHDVPVRVQKGQRIGMMKFGSRLDMYFPKDDIDVVVKEGEDVRAGETVIARLRKERGK